MSDVDSTRPFIVNPDSPILIRQHGADVFPGFSRHRLTAIGFQFRIARRWWCVFQCQCGNVIVASPRNVSHGSQRGCGCAHVESRKLLAAKMQELNRKNGHPNKTHGLSHTRLHSIWRGIKERCYNPKSSGYKHYGARGISMCREWKESFSVFHKWAISNGYSDTLTIDRKESNGHYEPSNCRWVDRTINSALARWKHGSYASTVIPPEIEVPFSTVLSEGRNGKRHPDNCPPLSSPKARSGPRQR